MPVFQLQGPIYILKYLLMLVVYVKNVSPFIKKKVGVLVTYPRVQMNWPDALTSKATY
jgi:hypothetical protein